MGYGKKDVQEALEAEEPSAIKDAYMIVRENKLMQVNPAYGTGTDNPYYATSPPHATHEESMASISQALESSSVNEKQESRYGSQEESQPSPVADSTRSTTSTVTSTSPRGYVSKVGILPTSLPALHREYLERHTAGAEEPEDSQAVLDVPSQPRTPAERQEAAMRLRPHARSAVRLDESQTRPQAMTPVAAPKKAKPTRWQFGIRSRNAPFEALLCIYKSLSKLGATWVLDEDYDKVHGSETDMQYDI
jgi:carbon catabolite-derepressing protein kinase